MAPRGRGSKLGGREGRGEGRTGPLGGMSEALGSGIWGTWEFLAGRALGLSCPLCQRQVLRLAGPGLEPEPGFQDGGTTQTGREGEARPDDRPSSLASAPRVLALARIALESVMTS